MDVFVIPLGPDRYELYCEIDEEPIDVEEQPPTGLLARMRHRFKAMVHAAEARQHAAAESPVEANAPLLTRAQDLLVAWVAERIAEQRLLWNLRRVTAATVEYPEDMTFEQTMTLVRRTLSRDYERHKVWLVVDTLGLIASAALMILPGPNVVAYYFAFRVVGHWLSMRGATQGLKRVEWSGKPCPPLSELRHAVILEAEERDRQVHDIAARLRLQHLPTFYERVAITRA